MILFKGCRVYAPEFLGEKDVLVAGGRIEALADRLQPAGGCATEIVDGEIPAPAARPDRLPRAHRRRRRRGRAGHAHSGNAPAGHAGRRDHHRHRLPGHRRPDPFGGLRADEGQGAAPGRGFGLDLHRRLPGADPHPCSATSGKDIAMIEEVIGVGEIAIADHRSSSPSLDELIRLAKLARVGGMIGGKAGIVNIHLGDAPEPFAMLYAAVEKSELQFSPVPAHPLQPHPLRFRGGQAVRPKRIRRPDRQFLPVLSRRGDQAVRLPAGNCWRRECRRSISRSLRTAAARCPLSTKKATC